MGGCVVIVAVGIALAAAASAQTPEARFTAVDHDQFAAPGALSNAWADFDNDGNLDLVVTFKSGEVRLYRNDGKTFASVGGQLGLPLSGDDARGAAWGDYDGDGYVDLYIDSFQRPIPGVNKLYRNVGGQQFVEVAKQVGVDMPGASSRQASWIDYDNDGDLDLFVAERSGLNRLFRNDGAIFADVTQASGMFDPRRSVGACWFDFDKDGDLDVFIANQAGDRDAFYRNDGGRFTDIAMALDMDKPRRPVTEGSVGCAVGDYDNDGNLDLFIAAYGDDMLYRNEGNGRFADVAHDLGITGHHHHDSAVWGDYDNDGKLDLYVVAFRADNPREKDRLYRNTGRGFVDVLPQNIAARDGDHGALWADYDGDGDLDLALTHSDDRFGGEPLYRNDSSRNRYSLAVSVLDRRGHHTRAGAEVRLYDAKQILLATRIVDTGGGYNAQNTMPVHFGLAQREKVVVEVTFLTRQGREVVRSKPIDPKSWQGRALIVRQPE